MCSADRQASEAGGMEAERTLVLGFFQILVKRGNGGDEGVVIVLSRLVSYFSRRMTQK